MPKAAQFQMPAEFSALPDCPEIEVERLSACTACGATESAEYAVGVDYELRSCRNVWHFERCLACTHVQLNPRPAVSTLPVIYPNTYYSYDFEKRISPLAVRGKAWLDQRKFRGILKHLGHTPTSYLDIGCGDGRYLRLMQAAGVASDQLYGLELDPRAAQRLSATGLRVVAERVETTAAVPQRQIDLVTMFHVIEHVEDPGQVLARIFDWLRPGGVLALETPNVDALDARLFRRSYWGGYHIPRHWHLFHADSLGAMLRRAGFEVLNVRYQTGHSFWLYSLHHAIRYNRRCPSPRFASLFDPLRRLLPLVVVTAFDLLRGWLGFRTSSMLVLARRPAP